MEEAKDCSKQRNRSADLQHGSPEGNGDWLRRLWGSAKANFFTPEIPTLNSLRNCVATANKPSTISESFFTSLRLCCC
jgi:hypothetical protein